MADDKQPSQWSTTAGSNTTVDTVSIAENCAMENLNNGMRAIMAGVCGALTFVATSGTDTYTATMAPAIDAYTSGAIYLVNFGNANTSTTPTLNLNSIGAKTITTVDGAALEASQLHGPHLLEYDGTNLRVLNPVRPIFSKITNSLSGDVSISSTSTFFDGPSVAQGTSGTWFASGRITVTSTTTDGFYAKLWDGTTVIDSAWVTNNVANAGMAIPLSGCLASPAANIKISVENITSTNGKIVYNQTGLSKDSTLTAIRIG